MSLTHLLILFVLIVVPIVAVLLAMRSGGPRVTTIETKREREKDGNDA